MNKKSKNIIYSDFYGRKHNLDNKGFKTIYSVDVVYSIIPESPLARKYKTKKVSIDYDNFNDAMERMQYECPAMNKDVVVPSNMVLNSVVIRSTSYLDGKEVGSEKLATWANSESGIRTYIKWWFEKKDKENEEDVF